MPSRPALSRPVLPHPSARSEPSRQGGQEPGSRRRRALLALPAAAAAILVFGACGGSGFNYVSSSSNGAYFKVPKNWKVFETEEVLAGVGDTRAAANYRFIAIFDADPNPTMDRDLKTAKHPFGIAQIRALTSTERDEFSLKQLRNELVSLDAIATDNPETIDLIEPPRAVTLDNGLSGARHVYTIRGDEGAWTVHQTGLVDPQTRHVYFFIVGCEAACYAGNERIIKEIAASWTIKEP